MSGDRPGSSAVQLVTIDENNDGQRLDNFLLGRLKGVPRSWVYRVLRRGEAPVLSKRHVIVVSTSAWVRPLGGMRTR